MEIVKVPGKERNGLKKARIENTNLGREAHKNGALKEKICDKG